MFLESSALYISFIFPFICYYKSQLFLYACLKGLHAIYFPARDGMISIHEMYLYFENFTTGRKSLGNRKIQVIAYIDILLASLSMRKV